MTVQSVNVDKNALEEFVTSRGLTLHELSRLATHHSDKVRKDAIEGVQELIDISNGTVLRGCLREVLDCAASTMSDGYRTVRKASRDLLRVILRLVSTEKLAPFRNVLSAYLSSALTSLKIKVRLDAVATFRVVMRLRSNLLNSENIQDILQTFPSLLGSAKGHLVTCRKVEHEDDVTKQDAIELIVDSLRLVMLRRRGHSKVSSGVNEQQQPHAMWLRCSSNINSSPQFQEVITPISKSKLQEMKKSLCAVWCEHLPISSSSSNQASSQRGIISVLEAVATVLGTIVREDDDDISKLLVRSFPFNTNDFENTTTNDSMIKVVKLNLIICDVLTKLTKSQREWIDIVVKFLNSRFLKTSNDENEKQQRESMKLLIRVIAFLKKRSEQQRLELVQSFQSMYERLPWSSSVTTSKRACVPTLIHLILHQNFRNTKWISDIPKLLWHIGTTDTNATRDLLQILLHDSRSRNTSFEKFMTPFFCALRKTTGQIMIGPFSKLPCELQRLAVSLVYYSTEIPKPLLRSLALCTSLPGVSVEIARLIVQVVGMSHRNGRLDLASYLSFLISCAFAAPDRVTPPYYDIFGADNDDDDDKVMSSLSSKKRDVVMCVCEAIRQFKTWNADLCVQKLLAPSLDHVLCNITGFMHPRTAEIAMSLAVASFDDHVTSSEFGTWLPRHIIHSTTSSRNPHLLRLATECSRLVPSILLKSMSLLLQDITHVAIEPLIKLMQSEKLIHIWRENSDLEKALLNIYRKCCGCGSSVALSKFRVEFRVLYNRDLD